MADLRSKLRMMDAAPKKPSPQAPRAEPDGCYRAQALYPPQTFQSPRSMPREVLASVFGCDFPREIAPEDVLFLDTETTGLSGGVGTVAFEVGVGYFTPAGFVVEQLLMRNYAQEPELLEWLCARMKRFSVLCTFNGRAFDAPLLKSRLLMNRMRDDCFPEIHADALYPARRLWKLRLKRCGLSSLETALLHVEREDDLPGALVPQTYFQYLKDGDFTPLLRVLAHNRQDIVSLAQIFFMLLRQVERPEEIAAGEDLLSLARALEKRGETQKAVKCYRLCASGATRAEAYRSLAVISKREGRAEAAVRLLESMLRRGEEPLFACEALAKLYEHQLANPEQALHYTRQALLLLAEPTLQKNDAVQAKRIALQYRYARLRRKLNQAPPCDDMSNRKGNRFK